MKLLASMQLRRAASVDHGCFRSPYTISRQVWLVFAGCVSRKSQCLFLRQVRLRAPTARVIQMAMAVIPVHRLYWQQALIIMSMNYSPACASCELMCGQQETMS
jgi:hypothetical protein